MSSIFWTCILAAALLGLWYSWPRSGSNPVKEKLKEAKSPKQKEEESQFYKLMKACPDCGCTPPIWMQGPSGGMTTNIFCGECGQGWNVCGPPLEYAERIGRNVRYIQRKGATPDDEVRSSGTDRRA